MSNVQIEENEEDEDAQTDMGGLGVYSRTTLGNIVNVNLSSPVNPCYRIVAKRIFLPPGLTITAD